MNNTAEEFEKKFQEKEYEMYILTESNVKSAGISDDHYIPSVNFIASANVQTGEIYRERGEISWIVRNDMKGSEWINTIRKYGIYHIKARRSVRKVLNDYISVRYNSYMLTEILECDPDIPELRSIAEEYAAENAGTAESEVENFKIRRDIGGYTGFADWMGARCMVTLEFDEDSDRAEGALSFFRKFCSLLPGIDADMRRYASSAFSSYSGKKKDPDYIAGSLRLSDLDVSNAGEITAFFENDEVLEGGTIEVHVQSNGKLLYAEYNEE